MHREPDAFLNQVVGGRWRLLEVLGATEHGAVYRVETVEAGGAARLELWDARHVEQRGELARFEREARTLSRLRHERCVSLAAFGAHEGRPFVVTELPPGKTLRDELGKPELTVRRALALGLQLCEALQHLHGHGVVHRALVPDNLWVGPSPAADVLKLGLPRFGPPADRVTGARPGDRLYLPPERLAARTDTRADLYAAGMLLYVMCTGREPAADVAATIAAGEPVPPPRAVAPDRGIGEGLERVILRAVAPAPDVRFKTAGELLEALQSAGARPPAPSRRPAQRRRTWTATAATAFAAVVVVSAAALRSSGRQTPPVTTDEQGAPPVAAAPAKVAVVRPAPAPVAAAKVVTAPSVAAAAPAAPAAPARATSSARVGPPAPVAMALRERAPAAPVEAAAPLAGAPPEPERAAIWSLLDRGQLDEGGARIKALLAQKPDAAWPHFALGVLYQRKYWRRESLKQWRFALAEDPEIRRDPQFGAYLCFMLDDDWKAAGVTELLSQLGPRAAPLLERCVASAKSARLRAQASRALETVRSH